MSIKKYFTQLFRQSWTETEALRDAEMQSGQGKAIDKKLITVLIYTAVCLSITKYFGNSDKLLLQIGTAPGSLGAWLDSIFQNPVNGQFYSLCWWLCVVIFFYLLVPLLIIRQGFREKPSAYGFSLKNVARDYPIYLLMLAFMLPLVYYASSTASFQSRYPMYKADPGHLFPNFFIWELLYLLQFVGVEFLFRGFILHGTKKRFGFYSIFVMTIPYCMIHFGKPFFETIAAIIAGVVLGALSLRSRSIAMGVFIHYSVAITMDLLAMWREGSF